MNDFRPDIWRLQAQFDTEGLIEALQDPDTAIRKRASAALRALGVLAAIDPLRAALRHEQDPDTRENMLAALAELDELKAINEREADEKPDAYQHLENLIQQLLDDDESVVIAAAKELGDIGNKRAVEPLVMLFNNGNLSIKVRLAVAEALLKLESAPVEVALLGALRSSKWRVRRNGAAILGQLRAEWAVDPLTEALKDDNDVVRRTARAALKRIDTPESRAALSAAGMLNKSSTTDTQEDLAAVTEDRADAAPEVDEDDDDDSPMQDTLTWPKRSAEIIDRTTMPTKPLDPSVLEEAKDRLNGDL